MSWDVKYRGYSEPPPPSKRFYQTVSPHNMDIVVYSGNKSDGKVISKNDFEVIAKYKQMDLVFDEDMTISKRAFNELRKAYFDSETSGQVLKSQNDIKNQQIKELSKQINKSEEREKELQTKIKELEGKLQDALYRPTFKAIIKDWLAAKLAKPRPTLPPCGPYR